MPTQQHFLDASTVHYEWNNAIPPRLEINAGDTVVFETRDASDEFYNPNSTHEDVMRRVFKGHPLTGPVRIRGARPGDVLAVEIVDIAPRASFGWTNVRPGRGLMPESEFGKPFLQIWDVTDGKFARGLRTMRNVAVPLAPFPGVMGVALDDAGSHNTAPPRKNGGNMDIKHLTAGTTVFLPVWVEGALFSIGDAHGAQGDGEVCITAVEMNARITLKFDLLSGGNLSEPQMRTSGPLTRGISGPHYVTTAHGPDLYQNARQAVRHMIDHLVRHRGLSREEAYILCSVAVDLKISEIVDAPNWIVSAFLPEMVFGGAK
jgi:acetamidase/formamidase